MRYLFLFPLVFLFHNAATAQAKNDALLKEILAGQSDSLLEAVLSRPEIYRYQIIYTQIDRDKNNSPSFKNYYYNVDDGRYFNPASVVKMPLAFLSLEKLNDIKIPGVNKFTAMQFDSGWSGQTKAYTDSTAENNLPSIAHYIKKAFLISDNDAYNRMYEFIGQQSINRRLHSMGYPGIRITRRFMRMNADENRHTNPIRFIDKNAKVIYSQPMEVNKDSFDFSQVYKMGNAHYNSQDSLIHEPIDFTTANNLPLEDMQQLLQSVIFPNSIPASKRFRLTTDDLNFLYRFLSQYPSETNFPKYDTNQYYDSYVKFFFRSPQHSMPGYVRVFNKVGWAYGCLTDVSYVADFKNKVEFMLALTIYVNSDGILNDDKYDYETIGWPFLYKAGQTIYQYELKRPRTYKPDLSRFKMKYSLRKEDGRPAIRDADN
ncbi:serine hydrolase [Terrimonas pollutisoli]|uniref:serine hydrolase n=1 Tax=Terrimonas pollutisoli TaxID=3034147 RepID=UPI0023EC8294|nr:serine hydrolase [Terrimonas sp. H1YJ31]